MEKIILDLYKEVIVLFFLCLILFFIILNIILLFSTLKIEIKDLEFTLPKKYRKINNDYEISIKLYILKKIRIIKLTLNNKNPKINEKIRELERKVVIDKKSFDFTIIEAIKKLDIKLENFELKLYLGTEDAAITAISIGIISSILGIILKNRLYNNENTSFETIPIYEDINFLKIYFNCIFKTNLIHIIHIIYILKTKGKVDKNDRTSNRRAYAYSNEQY